MKNNSTQSFIVPAFLTLCTISVFFPELSFAGTGGEELQTVYDKTVAFAQGYGGKTIAAISFIGAMISAVRGNLMAFAPTLGVSIVAAVGPQMVTSGISALI